MKPFEIYYTWPIDAAGILLRYLFFAGVSYFIFYVWLRNSTQSWKIQPKEPKADTVRREIMNSFTTLLIYCGVSWGIFYCWDAGLTLIYSDMNEYGVIYFVFSVLMMVVIHDAYFYWTHRWLHLPAIYSIIHHTHHRSVNPTPWAAFSFHPLEAVVAAGIMPLIVFTMPCHPAAILLFLNYMTLISVMGHLGYETFPIKLRNGKLGKWHNTATNHTLHHEYVHGNYGLYFTFWDRMMGTYRERRQDAA